MIKLPKNMAELSSKVHWKDIVSSAKTLQDSVMKEAGDIKHKLEATRAAGKDSRNKKE